MLHLDGYTDPERIGHGGLGDVYRATRSSTGETVAVKLLRDVSDESAAWNRLRRELTALVSLGGHAHVIRVLEVLEHAPGLVMEYAPGGSVAQLLDRRGTTLDVAEVALIGRSTAAALAAAHEQGIVHRDVKPQNLLVDGFGQVKLCDFGIASLTRTDEFRARTSAISMRYASPEDLEEDAEVGPPSDVYSLGATLLHLLHGAPPTLKERLTAWVPTATADDELAALDEIVAACLQPTPARRPTAPELHDRLEALEWRLHDRRRALEVAIDRPVEHHADGTGTPHAEERLGLRLGDREPFGGAPSRADPSADAGADATVYRTGRAPAPLARPSPAPPERRRTLPVLAVVVAAAAVTGVVLWRADDAAAPAITATTPTPTTTPTTTAPRTGTTTPGVEVIDRPEGLADLDDPSIVWPLGSIGECLVQVPEVGRLQPVGCDRPHDLQRYAVGALPEGTTSRDEPDDAELELAVADRCLEAAPSTWPSPDLRVAQTNPSAATWSGGDRGYQCLVGVPGHRIVGSVPP